MNARTPLPPPAAVESALVSAAPSIADVVMAWLAAYVPSWGTSVVLHVAALLLAAFLAWPTPATPVETIYTVVPRIDRPLPTVVRREPVRTPEPAPDRRDRTEALPGSPRRPLDPVLPLPASAVRAPLVITRADPNAAARSLTGWGGEGGQPLFPPGPREGGARRIVYLMDRSGSMTDAFDLVKAELKRSVTELAEDVEFHVLFFSAGPPVEMPARRLVPATETNKRLACEFIDRVRPEGQTDPTPAIERALAAGPDLVYLLTDGEFDRAVVDLVRRRNAGRAAVYTIGFLYRDGEAVLREIAGQNRGEYTFVSEADLARLVGP